MNNSHTELHATHEEGPLTVIIECWHDAQELTYVGLGVHIVPAVLVEQR
jgi:hypothetical protein